jgi:hypothetical protein
MPEFAGLLYDKVHDDVRSRGKIATRWAGDVNRLNLHGAAAPLGAPFLHRAEGVFNWGLSEARFQPFA